MREFELKDEKSKIPSTQIPRHFDSEFIPPVFRERLREIIHKSLNTGKSSSYLRSKFVDFLNHGYRIECVRPLPTPAATAPLSSAPQPRLSSMIPTLHPPPPPPPLPLVSDRETRLVSLQLHESHSSTFAPSPMPLESNQVTLPVSQVSAARSPPRVLSRPNSRSLWPLLGSPKSCLPRVNLDCPSPSLDREHAGMVSTGQRINARSLFLTIKRFNAGSNHKIKRLDGEPIYISLC